jgi:nucleotide-binding universal stress UspA family protein
VSTTQEPPNPDTLQVRAVLLASEEGTFPTEAVDLAARLAKRSGAPVHVFSIARIWGTSFGFPAPGLMPTRKEWDAQRDRVDKAIRRLEKKGVDARGEIIGTRAGAKRIVAAAEANECDAIVMAAKPPRNRFLGDFMWSQEPYRVRRKARQPVYLVPLPE